MGAFPDDELVRHARALRGLARALVGVQDADDLVQDTAAHVLARTPGDVRSWFQWFGGVMRKRAAKLHRAEGRRALRERRGRGDEAGASESALRVAAHRETIARLDAALLALPEPYQTALILRHFEDLTPNEIAARTGDPVATVKSRLQRGLGMLRARMVEANDGGDWRAGLVLAFGLGRETAPVGGVVAIGAMAMSLKIVLGVAAVSLAAVLLWPRGAEPQVVRVEAREVGQGAVAVGPVAEANAPREAASVEQAQREAVPAMPAANEPVTFVGRCVDAAKTPLAGVAIRGTTRVTSSGKELGKHETTSDDAGAFLVRLPVAPRAHQSMEMSAPGCCALEGYFHDRRSGECVDLGDVLVPVAHRVTGKVVDEAGTAQAGVKLQVWPQQDQKHGGLLGAWIADQVTTNDAGRIEPGRPFPPGDYVFVPTNRELAAGTIGRVSLHGPAAEHVVDLTVRAAPVACRGVVVDEAGAAIAGASVRLDDSNVAVSDAEGRFAVLPNPNSHAPDRRVAASAEGFGEQEQAWRVGQASELRFVLKPTPALRVVVVDSRDGSRVRRFAAGLVRTNSWGSQWRPPELAEHAEGIATLRAARGRWFLLVRAADEVLAPSPFVPVQLLDGRTATITVELAPWQLRRLVVTDGRDPVPGVHVELLDPGDVVLRRDTLTTTLEDARYGGPSMARILAMGDTDAGGALELRGPCGPLALRLSGGGLPIHVVQPIRLDEPGELRLAVPRGAQWRGRLVPADVAKQLFALGQPAPGVEAEQVGIELAGENGSLLRLGERPAPFAADGSFVIADIPPGTWHAVVHAQSPFTAATITVAPGQRIEQDIDVRAMAIADVVLTVRVAGELQRNTLFCAIGSHGTDALGHRFASGTNKRSDADGRLSFRTFAGVVLLHVYWRSADLSSVLQTAVVVRGAGPQQIDVALEIGALDLTVLTPDGAPAADLECELAPSGARGGNARTDASGAIRRAVMAAGSYDLRVRPGSLRTAEARDAFALANGWPALEEAWVHAGTIQVGAGAPVPQTVRLPASWNR